MSGPNSEENLRELIEPVRKNFDGIVCTFHYPKDSGAAYLEEVKGHGKVIYTEWCKRHDFSRNHYLYSGPIKNGDWCVQIDVLERFGENFIRDLRSHIDYFKSQGVNMVYYYNKPFLFEYHESLMYRGSPHEGLLRMDGQAVGIELSKIIPNEPDVRYNVRPLKRKDPYNWVDHYLRYYLYPWGSNHCLLGLEGNHPKGNAFFHERDAQRLKFLQFLDSHGINRDTESVIDWLKANKDNLHAEMKQFINSDLILNDVYRYHVLGDKSIRDRHDWSGLIKI